MRLLTFANRNTKEILRDPINMAFGLGFPLVLLVLFSTIQANIPVELFEIQTITPGITIFGLSFMTLFSASLIAKDRGSAFLQRLYTTPLRARDFILGYTLPVLPMAVAQCLICYLAAIFFGFKWSCNVIYSIVFFLPIALLYVALGLLCGSLLTDKQVGGVCGALLTNLSGWLAGIWFDISHLGGTFEMIAGLLPFVHAVELERAVLAGRFSDIFPHLWWVIGYAFAILIAAIWVFLRQMKRQ